ncbi:TlyA family RNA methyltransferase [Leucobacter sp. CSA1]|uniref:TlyA family RNA methyltransferase n=1 Tax=Leucobacter chromiisoli TaxID=2796471 RepID=A0A934Q9Z0_9MICO|nr:TlyA family RNA methyltransferase [Leucobacter chromiisoli]MBK0419881.1 TlyA family RNA methyltransferase [Leucobacter chromiisoli]
MPSGTWAGAAQRLDRALAELGLVRSRSRAAELVAEGRVLVDGAVAAKAGQRIAPGSRIELEGADRYVGRAAHKLVAALDAFGVDPAGRLALDLGASTGGFTQVLLERGAEAVQAIDVGHDQLAPQLRNDDRVRLVEGCNARDLTAERLAADTGIDRRPDLVVADLSFISLTLILPAIARTAAEGADLVLLIKPQFEVGRLGIRDGIVTDPEQRASAVRAVLAAAAGLGYATRGLDASPIAGTAGNREFLVHFAPSPRETPPDPTEWEGRIRELCSDAGPVAEA